jgi:hypothetical protein
LVSGDLRKREEGREKKEDGREKKEKGRGRNSKLLLIFLPVIFTIRHPHH